MILKNFQQITIKTFKPHTKNIGVGLLRYWESLPDKSLKKNWLKNRINVVLTRNTDLNLKKEIESHKDTYVN